MRIVSFIDQGDVIQKILKHCNLWKEPVERAPPKLPVSADVPTGITYDTEFLNTLVG
jgi:hypothetical protein